MAELNLDPNVMVDQALARLNSGEFSIASLSATALNRAAEAATPRLRESSNLYAVTADVGGAAERGWSNLVDGIQAGWIDIAQTIAFLLSIILSILFVSIVLRLRVLNKVDTPIADQISPPEPAQGGPLTARWREIEKHMDSVREAEWKFAVIEADKLLDDVLRRGGFPGDTLGERLSNLQPGQLANIDNLWEAHKVRNRVAHEVNYFLRYTEAKHALDQYASAMRELGAL